MNGQAKATEYVRALGALSVAEEAYRFANAQRIAAAVHVDRVRAELLALAGTEPQWFELPDSRAVVVVPGEGVNVVDGPKRGAAGTD